MNILEALLQGILQGLTEFLPVSSSGHLSLFQHFFGAGGKGGLAFDLMLHLGTLAAVIAVFYEEIWALVLEFFRTVRDIFTGRFHFKTDVPERRLLFMLVIATLPLALVVPLRGAVARVAEDNSILLEGLFFLVTALLLFGASGVRQGKAGILKMHAKQALPIGVAQALATFPGISRSGATISTGMILGFDRQTAVTFSFLLGIPAVLGGAVLEVGDAVKEDMLPGFGPLVAGMLAAAVVGYLAILLVRRLLLAGKWRLFAWYTLAVGILVIAIALLELAVPGLPWLAQGVPSAASGANSVSAAHTVAAFVP